ncbi:MAG: glycerophosphodiester phosphodiesterase, partial [Gemmatimonadetes bacterium]|nr:glycerophosphodiester phosphodiesterase [Gemmatimonadota bacterium]
MRLFLKRALLALLLLALVLYGAFALTSHPVEPHPYFASGDVLVIAHRGGKGLAPENTLAAFAHSAALGVDVLEMDLRQSSDGALVVLHDRRVDRTTNGQGAADSLSLAQLKQLDAGYRFSLDGQTFPYRGQGVSIPT